MDEYYVYMHVNKINGKRYIGITKQIPEKRWANGTHYSNNKHFHNAILKYGWDNFEHIILYSSLIKEEACKMEVELIKEYNTTNQEYGYNLDSGGSAPQHSQETKDKIRKKITGIKRSDQTKEKIRKASIGNKNCLGRKASEETREKIRKVKTGIKYKKRTEEQLAKARQSQRHKMKQVLCVELGIVFDSVTDASNFVNGSQGTLSWTLFGKRETAYGYHWKFCNDNIKA